MTKLIKKSKCTFENGYIIKKNKVVGIPRIVHLQLDKLECMLQQMDYLITQPAGRPGPSLNGWQRKSALKSDRPYFDAPDTPVTDRRVEEAMQFMKEVDAVQDTVDTNKLIDEFGELIDWCAADKFVEGTDHSQLDLYVLGNPLELKPQTVAALLGRLVTSPVQIEEL